jgi:hypothetical protein
MVILVLWFWLCQTHLRSIGGDLGPCGFLYGLANFGEFYKLK